MFQNFPKIRTTLADEYMKIYTEHYRKNREGQTTASSLSQKMERWLHKKVAADLKSNDKHTLEIGAGTLNQLQYENTRPYDIIEPFEELYTKSPYLNKVRKIYKDISEINPAEKYDRITAIATFEHITNLPEVVAKTCQLLKENGSLRVSIPNEGSFLWWLGWKLTTGLEFKIKYKLDYGLLLKYEHVNTAKEIEVVLKYFYRLVKPKNFGLTKYFAFYRFFECMLPDKNNAEKFLSINN